MWSGGRAGIFLITWWIVWASFHAWVVSAAGQSTDLSITEAAVSSVILGILSAAVSFPVRYYRPRDARILFLGVWSLLLSLLWVFAVSSIMQLYTNNEAYIEFLSRSAQIRTVIGFLILSAFIAIAYLVQHTRSNQEEEAYRLNLEKQSKDAELVSLRQQLQPHFLFNTLNSINSLIGSRPEEAREMTRKLSEFLRGTLTGVTTETNSLKEELKHLELYLDIEKVRFGNRLKTVINCKDAHTETQVPSLLLQPLVENAIKFGLYDTLDEVLIDIDCRSTADELEIRISNPFDPLTSNPKKGTGFGISSVKRKLILLYNRHDLLSTTATDSTFTVSIKIPLRK